MWNYVVQNAPIVAIRQCADDSDHTIVLRRFVL